MKIRWYWCPTMKTWWWWLLWMTYQQKYYLLFNNFLSNIKRNDKSNVKFIEMSLFAIMSLYNYMLRKSIVIHERCTYVRLSHELRLLDVCYNFSISNKNSLADGEIHRIYFKKKNYFWKHRYNGLSHELRQLDLCIFFFISNKIYENRKKNRLLGRRRNTKNIFQIKNLLLKA